jgi:ribosome biogenesis GTPase
VGRRSSSARRADEVDLAADAEALREQVAAVAPGVDVLVVSAVTGTGIDALAVHATERSTLALLGPSGAGKSTLTNALARSERMATRALRADGKGRHTTAHRELVTLPNGAFVIDTPGLRSVGLALPTTRSTGVRGRGRARRPLPVHRLRPRSEPGCAVLAAAADGSLAPRRLESWRKLQREARWMAMRHDARLRATERARWRSVTAEVRRSGRTRR